MELGRAYSWDLQTICDLMRSEGAPGQRRGRGFAGTRERAALAGGGKCPVSADRTQIDLPMDSQVVQASPIASHPI